MTGRANSPKPSFLLGFLPQLAREAPGGNSERAVQAITEWVPPATSIPGHNHPGQASLADSSQSPGHLQRPAPGHLRPPELDNSVLPLHSSYDTPVATSRALLNRSASRRSSAPAMADVTTACGRPYYWMFQHDQQMRHRPKRHHLDEGSIPMTAGSIKLSLAGLLISALLLPAPAIAQHTECADTEKQPSCSDQAEHSDHSGHSGQSEHPGKPEHSGQPAHSGHSDHSGHPAQEDTPPQKTGDKQTTDHDAHSAPSSHDSHSSSDH
jgi:hypothetical protein